jgi:hypothetical protein
MVHSHSLAQRLDRALARGGATLLIPVLILAVPWVQEVVDQLFFAGRWNLPMVQGGSFLGVLTAPFSHGGFGHLISNTLWFVPLSWLVSAQKPEGLPGRLDRRLPHGHTRLVVLAHWQPRPFGGDLRAAGVPSADRVARATTSHNPSLHQLRLCLRRTAAHPDAVSQPAGGELDRPYLRLPGGRAGRSGHLPRRSLRSHLMVQLPLLLFSVVVGLMAQVSSVHAALIQLRGGPLGGGRVRGGATVPLERAPGGHTPVLTFRTLRGEVRLLVDTGASSSMVTPGLATRLSLPIQSLAPGPFPWPGGERAAGHSKQAAPGCRG